MKEEEKICHYLDLPIQHASDDILRRMGQKDDRKPSCWRLVDHLPGGDPGYLPADHADRRFPGRDPGGA